LDLKTGAEKSGCGLVERSTATRWLHPKQV